MAIIEVNNVTKEYQLGQLTSLKQNLLNSFYRLRGRKVEKHRPFRALDNINFHVEPGEVVGIIGTNGAGKSTLLKILSRICKPTTGAVKVHGRVAPLIEVGAGLVGDMTGRENIYLNGSILGMTKKEIDRKIDEIIAFAELEEFIDTPIKRYSSGMQVRLGFSIATSVDVEILIVDEVLSVGDLAFQRKCFDRMEDMIKRQRKTVLVVSHNIRQLERLCSRIILLEQGKVVADGNPTKISNLFYELSNNKIKTEASKQGIKPDVISNELDVKSVDLYNYDGNTTDVIPFKQSMRVRILFEMSSRLEDVSFYVGLHTTDFVYISANNTADKPKDYDIGLHWIDIEFKSVTLLPGVYCILAWVGTSVGKCFFYGENLITFQVSSNDYIITRQRDNALVYLEAEWFFSNPSLV